MRSDDEIRSDLAELQRLSDDAMSATGSGLWRVGNHYGIHVYEDDTPIATFHSVADAKFAVAAVNAVREGRLVEAEPDVQDREEDRNHE